ncbi:CARDB domain-containing protein [Hyphococcus sp.]|uniref:CARDB domain-containing protein n=2 Tax=Hyphococcus sp. TaxID=2038636 RepID=UPI0035C6BDD2
MPSDPTASGGTYTKSAGESTPLSALVSYFDADGDIVSFAVKDREVGGGYLTLGGVPLPEDVLYDEIPISEIGQWAFVAGPSGTTSTIGFNAIDSRGAYNLPSAEAIVNVPAPTPPDLLASLTSTPPSSVSAGSTFTINYALLNSGDSTAGAFLSTFYISTNNVFGDGDDLALELISTGGLAGGASTNGSKSILVPDGLGAGTYYIALVADQGGGFPSGQVSESNESNNQSNIYSFTVTAPPPVANISGSVTEATEGSGQPLIFLVNLDRIASQDITVSYNVGGSASSSDYAPLSGSVVIAAGTSSASISVYPVDDGVPEGDETVQITLTGISSGAQLGSSLSSSGVIHDGALPAGDDFADEASDASAPVGIISVGGFLEGNIDTADSNDTYGDKDVFRVHLVQGQTYQVQLQSADLGGQILPLGIFTLRNPANFNDVLITSGIGSNVSNVFSPELTGDYYIRVGTGGAATDEGGYRISVSDVTPAAPDDFPDYPDDAGALNPIQTLSLGPSSTGAIEAAGDKDVFKVALTAGRTYQFSLNGEAVLGAATPLANLYMTLRNPGDFYDVEIGNGGLGLATLTYEAQQSGTYYLRIGDGGSGSGTGGYRIDVDDLGLSPSVVPTPPETDAGEAAAQWIDDRIYEYVNLGIELNGLQWDAVKVLIQNLNGADDALVVVNKISNSLSDAGYLVDTLSLADRILNVDPAVRDEVIFIELADWAFGTAAGIGLGFLGGFSGPFAPVAIPLTRITGELAYDQFLSDWARQQLDILYDGEDDGLWNRVDDPVVSLSLASSNAVLSSEDFDESRIVVFDQEYYLSSYAEVASLITSGSFGSAFAHFLTVGIDNGYQPNASQIITRDDLVFSILNNDPAALTNSALLTQPLGAYAGDGLSAAETAVFDSISATRADALGIDAKLSAIAARKAFDLVVNFADSAVGEALSNSNSNWAAAWSNGNTLTQQFRGAFEGLLGPATSTSRYEFFVVASESSDPDAILAELASQTGGAAALAKAQYNTIGLAEFGGVWVVILADRIGSYSVVSPGADGLAATTQYGGLGDDMLFAGARDAVFYGLDGADEITGGLGTDSAEGGADNDTLTGGDGADTLKGGDGDDKLYGYLQDLAQSVIYDDGANLLDGGEGNDHLFGSGAAETLLGGEGDDSLSGRGGADMLDGGPGMDLGQIARSHLSTPYIFDFSSGVGGDITEPGGAQLLSIERLQFSGGSGDEHVTGGANDDLFRGGGGDDSLYGLGGDDLLSGDDGADLLDGGPGYDFVTYEDAPAGVSIDLNAGVAVGGNAAGDTLISIEGVVGSTFNDTVSGSDGVQNYVFAGGGDDLLIGRDGSDTLDGAGGHDTLRGGSGNDWLDGDIGHDELRGEAGNDIIHAGGGADTVYAGFGDDTADGGAGADYVTGGDGMDSLDGGNGDDTVIGGDGADIVVGGAGFDSLVGNDGNDTLDGGNLEDTLRGQNDNDEMSGGNDEDSLAGGAGDDTLTGDGGQDSLRGGGGADTALGGIGHDLVTGGAGNDLVDGQNGNDTVIGGGGVDMVLGGAGTDSLTGGSGNDTLDGGNLNDTLRGGGDDDRMDGGNDDDLLFGGTGNDTLIGGEGNDTLAGNGGDDLFVFNAGEGADVINGFEAGAGTDDVIDLSSFDGVFDDFADVVAAASDVSGDVVIDLGGGHSIALAGVQVSQLHSEDFIFT